MDIKEIDGMKYRVMPNGGLLKFTEKKPILCGVYCITETTTNKMYVGSSKNISQRIRAYKKPSNYSGVLRDIDLNNIDIDVLELCSEVELKEKELYYILLLDTKYPKGFNKKCPITSKNFDGVANTKRSNLLPKYMPDNKPKPIKHTKKLNTNILIGYPDL